MSPSVDWATTLPWLQYPEGSADLFLNLNDVQSKLLFEGGSLTDNEVSQLSFVVATYNISGSYLGMQLFETQLQVRSPRAYMPLCLGQALGSTGLSCASTHCIERATSLLTFALCHVSVLANTGTSIAAHDQQQPLQLCGAQTYVAGVWRHVGSDFHNECAADAAVLLQHLAAQTAGPLFFDLYYVDGVQGGSGSSSSLDLLALAADLPGAPTVYPVPVLLQVPGTDTPALVRRFFSVDGLLGTEAGDGSPSWVQYVSKASLVIQVRCCFCRCFVPTTSSVMLQTTHVQHVWLNDVIYLHQCALQLPCQ